MVNSEERDSVHSVDPVVWEEHSHDCKTCNMTIKKSKGGRPTKKGNRKRSTTSSTWSSALLNSSFLLSPNDVLTVSLKDLKINLSLNPAMTEFVCKLCNDILKRPLTLSV